MVSVRYIDFTEKVKVMAMESLPNSDDNEAMCRLMKKLFRMAEQMQDSEIPQEEISKMACRSGCSHCCRVSVPVLFPEAVLIASYLKSNLNIQTLGRLMSRMERFVLNVAGYDEEERIASNIECVFLGSSGECTIHSVRPFACRAVISADANACKSAMRMALLDEYTLVPMNIKHKSINDSAFIGLAEALSAKGYDNHSMEITSAVLKHL